MYILKTKETKDTFFVLIKNDYICSNMKIVFFTGSGLSAESGLLTFRDSGGYWDKYSVEDVATVDGWHKNRELVLEFYNQYRRLVQSAKPNAAHVGISKFIKENPDYKVSVITQNVDDLLERAGVENVYHMHGSILEAKSTNKGFTYPIGYDDITLGQKGEDGSQLRPNVVFFGELVHYLEECAELVKTCDVLCIIGTSLNVYPASDMITMAQPRCRIYILDPNADELKLDNTHINICKTATEGIEELIEEIKN